MKVFIEGEHYPLSILESIENAKFYKALGPEKAKITHVGYFYSFKNKEVIYILPKVFIDTDKKVLSSFHKDELINSDFDERIKNKVQLVKFKYLLILFYRSLQEYKKRYISNNLLKKDDTLTLDSNIGEDEYSYLDIVLNIINFHRENYNTILFIEKKHRSQQHKKVSWEKTIKKTMPFFDKNRNPIYIQAYNKKKVVDTEEELLSMFYSVLYFLKIEYKFDLSIDKIYTIHKGKAFDKLSKKAPYILKKIKHKYFSDTLVKIYKLLELYFNDNRQANHKKKSSEYILVDNYHIIFEDMIDKLFSDELPKNLKKLKNQKDGKEVDHLFEYNSLIDSGESIFYIGDSKYYQIGSHIEEKSQYKQFTYAKNIIQFNIDILHGKQDSINKENLRYRDELTEGYNISPNFFIQGRIKEMEFENDNLLLEDKDPEYSYHFENRLFDRDTLFVHYYNINFLFVLKAYSQMNLSKHNKFKIKAKMKFRESMIELLDSKFNFYKKSFASYSSIKAFVNTNFREYHGKMYRTKKEEAKKTNEEQELILALEKPNTYSIDGFNNYILST